MVPFPLPFAPEAVDSVAIPAPEFVWISVVLYRGTTGRRFRGNGSAWIGKVALDQRWVFFAWFA